jgi:uncharacterized protein with von Willebrand factor type A (vWA) domain
MKEIDFEYCNRCHRFRTEDSLLQELAYNEDRYIPELVKKARQEPDSSLHKEATKYLTERLHDMPVSEEDETTDGMFLTDEATQADAVLGIPAQNRELINEEDVRQALEEYEHCGLIEVQGGKVIVTSRGGKKLAAGALERILKNLNRQASGPHTREKPDFGFTLSLRTRRYETGDDYSLVDIERTALNALKRCGKLEFEPGDFEVREEVEESKLCAAIIIDESGSMRDSNKLEAAMETALALSRLILRKPENSLKVYVFSDEVKQIEPWAIVNEVISGGDTDIKTALAAFRRACRHEYGDKQAYLITDTEPNNEDGRHLPFEKAANGLIEEASRYRREKIGLNIIMLDESPELKILASTLARKNLGRVFFTSPSSLGEVLIEDYIKGRREGISSRLN